MIKKWNVEISQLNIENSIQAIEKMKKKKNQAKYSHKLRIMPSQLKKQT